jgi:hypothetical protein
VQDLRAQLAIKTCLAAREHNCRIMVVDGSPCVEFKEALRDTGATVLDQQKPGMGQSRRECLRAGLYTTAGVVMWIEPEKFPVVPLLDPCAEMILGGAYDFVLPARYSLESYPRYQALSEHRAMWSIGRLTGRPDLDWMFGPRVMSRRGAEFMSTYDGSAGDSWHILVVPVLRALAGRDMRVGSRFVDYTHPAEQTAAEEGDETMDRKRDEQRLVLTKAVEEQVTKLGIESLK